MREKPATVTGYELDELRALIEGRSGIFFDASRERFFSTRVRVGPPTLPANRGRRARYDFRFWEVRTKSLTAA